MRPILRVLLLAAAACGLSLWAGTHNARSDDDWKKGRGWHGGYYQPYHYGYYGRWRHDDDDDDGYRYRTYSPRYYAPQYYYPQPRSYYGYPSGRYYYHGMWR